jgi:hypothetical protein
MQLINEPIRASLRFRRFNSATGKPRRRWAALAGGIALALVFGSGIAVAATSSAEAHIPKLWVNCSSLKVIAEQYNANSPDGNPTPNRIDVTIDGEVLPTVWFGNSGSGYDSFYKYFDFSDSTSVHDYTVTVTAWDDPDFTKGWSQTITDKSVPCVAPTVSAEASKCTVAGSTTAISARFSDLVAGREYRVDLSRGGSVIESFPVVSTQTTWPDTATGLPASWATLPAGDTYGITITDTTVKNLSASTSVVSVGCPQDAKVRVDVQQCTVAGGKGTFSIFADVVPQRSYEVKVYQDGNVIDSFTTTATAAQLTRSYAASPSSSFYFSIRDVDADVTATSIAQKLLPCPEVPVTPALTISQCTATSGPADSTLSTELSGLVPGRSYSIAVSGGTTVVPAVSLNPALSSTWSSGVIAVVPGTYTVTVTDTSDPKATGFTASASAVLLPCPTQPEVTLTPTVCTVPGGTADISAQVTTFAVGRSYSIALTQNNAAVAGHPAQDFTPTDASQPYLVTYTGLTAGLPYRVIVSDKLLSSVIGAADVTPLDCPGNPDLVLTPAKCTLPGATSTVTVGLDKLVAGQDYTVSITKKSNGAAIAGAPDKALPGSPAKQSVQFSNLPNGVEYLITVTNTTKTLTASGSILLSACEVQLTTLAYTGASTVTPTLAGIGFLQFGLVLVGISIFRRRSGALEA